MAYVAGGFGATALVVYDAAAAEADAIGCAGRAGVHAGADPVKIGTNLRFASGEGDISAEMVEFDDSGDSRETTSRQFRRQLERRAEKARKTYYKCQAQVHHVIGGPAVVKSYRDLAARM